MVGKRYIVKNGDSLWTIAKKQLGDSNLWTELFDWNNRIEISKKTGTRIINPGTIFVGQVLYIPEFHPPFKYSTKSSWKNPQVPKWPPSIISDSSKKTRLGPSTIDNQLASKNKSRQNPAVGPAKKYILFPPLKFDLNIFDPITIYEPNYIMTVRCLGHVKIQKTSRGLLSTIKSTGFKVSATNEAKTALGKMVSEISPSFNKDTNMVSLEFGLSSYSKNPRAYSSKVSIVIGPNLQPMLKGRITTPELNGKFADHLYKTASLSLDVEIVPNKNKDKPSYDPINGGVLIASAGFLIAATLVEDIYFPPGIANDTVSFATAAAMFTTGMMMMKDEKNTNKQNRGKNTNQL